MSDRPSRIVFARLLTCALCLALCACQGDRAREHSDVDLTTRPVYEDNRAQISVLDIQVIRDSTRITLTNTTARAYGESRLWINRWYSLDIDGFDVGQTLDLSLADFKDRYGEPFRAGGFFATRRPDQLAQAQLETDGQLFGLVAVPEKRD